MGTACPSLITIPTILLWFFFLFLCQDIFICGVFCQSPQFATWFIHCHPLDIIDSTLLNRGRMCDFLFSIYPHERPCHFFFSSFFFFKSLLVHTYSTVQRSEVRSPMKRQNSCLGMQIFVRFALQLAVISVFSRQWKRKGGPG